MFIAPLTHQIALHMAARKISKLPLAFGPGPSHLPPELGKNIHEKVHPSLTRSSIHGNVKKSPMALGLGALGSSGV